jgi:ABC-type branched-subunit amino acid transport system substrate-binding protein
VQAARKLVSGGANCLVGPYASGESIPVAKSISRRQKVPTISPSSTSAEITTLDDNGFFSRTAPSDTLQTVALADLLEKELGSGKTVSVLGRNDAYGAGLAASFKAEWEKRGGKVQGPVLYDTEQPSYNSEASQVVSGSPDGYLVFDFPETWVKVGAALLRTGKWDTSKVFSSDGLAADAIPSGIPVDSLEGVRGTRAGTPESSEAAREFDKLWKSADSVHRYTYDAQVFDATSLCILASVVAGSNDGTDISKALEALSAPPGPKYTYLQLPQAIKDLRAGKDIDFDGAAGPIDLDENGDPTAATYEQWQYVDKRLKLTGHTEVKTGGG